MDIIPFSLSRIRNEVLTHTTTWVDFAKRILTKVTQTQQKEHNGNEHPMAPFMWNTQEVQSCTGNSAVVKVTQQLPRTKERRDGSGCLMSTVFSLGGVKKVLEGVSRWLWNALQMPNVSEMYTLKYLKW